jgi:hypothetical protein
MHVNPRVRRSLPRAILRLTLPEVSERPIPPLGQRM